MRPGASWDAYCPRSLEKETRRRNLRILIDVEVHVWNWYLDGYASDEQLRLAHFKVFRCAFCQWMIHAGVLFGRHCKRLLLQRFFKHLVPLRSGSPASVNKTNVVLRSSFESHKNRPFDFQFKQ